jgi:hypothetical protein
MNDKVRAAVFRDALEVFFIAGDRYFEPDATPAHGLALQASMNRLAGLNAGMDAHTVCSGRHVCGCKLKLQSRKLDSKAKPSEIHVRRRQCHRSPS